MHQQMSHVNGTVLWYAKAVVDNVGNYGTILRNNYWKFPALQPLMPFIDSKAPKKPRKLKVVETSDGLVLFWQGRKAKNWGDEVTQYVVYRFGKGEKIDLQQETHIVGVSRQNFMKLPYKDGQERYVYIVTALDRMSNESKDSKIKIKI